MQNAKIVFADIKEDTFNIYPKKVEEKIKSNESVVLTIGTMAVVGIVTSISGSKAKISLKNKVVVLPGQKIAVSKKAEGRWKLIAYAVAK